jgi:hypothetical protein
MISNASAVRLIDGERMRQQKGVTLSGLIIVLFLVMIGALLAFKLFKPYEEYLSIQKGFKTLVQKPEVKSGNRRDIIAAWQPISVVQDIRTLSFDDIEINKDGNTVIVSATYSVKVPLFGNISLLLDFHPSSATP